MDDTDTESQDDREELLVDMYELDRTIQFALSALNGGDIARARSRLEQAQKKTNDWNSEMVECATENEQSEQ